MLSDVEIKALVSGDRSILAPFDPAALRPSSYVLALGDHLLVDATAKADVSGFDDEPHFVRKDEVDGRLTLDAGQFALSASRELISLPPDVSGLLSLGSRLARLGVLGNAGATLVQAGFGGDQPSALTFELFNASPRPIVLRAGMPFCHLILFRHTTPPGSPYEVRLAERGAGPSPARFE